MHPRARAEYRCWRLAPHPSNSWQKTVPEEKNIPFFFRRENGRRYTERRLLLHAAALADIERMFEGFPILPERRMAAASLLSGGGQQTLAIARALLSRPRLLLRIGA